MTRTRRKTRRDYGSGSLTIKGKQWAARYLDPVSGPDGTVRWVKRSKIIGSIEVMDREQASQKLTDLVFAIRNRKPEAKLTVGQYAEQIWLPRVLPSVKNSTAAHYRYIVDSHIKPCIGDVKLYELTDTLVQRLIDSKSRERAKVKGCQRLLSWKTVKHIWGTLGSITRLAVKQDLLKCNPVLPTRLPRRPYRDPVIGDEEQMLRELRLLLSELPEPSRSVAWLLLTTGMRIGECLALRWYDLDFDRNVIEVKDRLYEGVRDCAKTKNSVRTIPLLPVARQSLLKRRGESWKPMDLVFATRNGTAIERRNLARQVQATCDRLKIARVNWHWFRHVTASYLDSLGVPTSVVKELLGHYSESVTSRIYTHAAMDKVRAAVERIEQALNCPQTDPTPAGAEQN